VSQRPPYSPAPTLRVDQIRGPVRLLLVAVSLQGCGVQILTRFQILLATPFHIPFACPSARRAGDSTFQRTAHMPTCQAASIQRPLREKNRRWPFLGKHVLPFFFFFRIGSFISFTQTLFITNSGPNNIRKLTKPAGLYIMLS
jgi:hypothetical protein